MARSLITPDELRRIADEKEMEKAREALERKRKKEDEQHHLAGCGNKVGRELVWLA